MSNAFSRDRAHLVVLGCFGPSPAGGEMADAIREFARVLRVESRLQILRYVHARRPAFVLLPLNDSRGATTLPLIERLARAEPASATVVCVSPGASTRGLAGALRLEAKLLAWSTPADLQRGVRTLLGQMTVDRPDDQALDLALSDLHPVAMRVLFRRCVTVADRRLTVGGLVRALGTSRRSLNRATQHAGWPPPSELLAWARLFRASVVVQSAQVRPEPTEHLARLVGYRDAQECMADMARHLGRGMTLDRLRPQDVIGALQGRVANANDPHHS